MKHIEFNWTSRDGKMIYAQGWQPDETKGFVALVHGLGEHTGRYRHVAQAFAEDGYAMIGFDLPGHGRSEGKRGYTSYAAIMLEIDHLLEECRQRFPQAPGFLYGHSMGGALAANYLVTRHPDLAGAIISAPAMAPGFPVPPFKLFLARVFSRLYPSYSQSNGLDRSNLSTDPEVVAAYSGDPLVHDRISARLAWDVLTSGEKIIQRAGEVKLPVLIVQGSQDHLTSQAATQQFAQKLAPGLDEYKVWQGLNHETHNEKNWQEVLAYTLAWMDDRLAEYQKTKEFVQHG